MRCDFGRVFWAIASVGSLDRAMDRFIEVREVSYLLFDFHPHPLEAETDVCSKLQDDEPCAERNPLVKHYHYFLERLSSCLFSYLWAGREVFCYPHWRKVPQHLAGAAV